MRPIDQPLQELRHKLLQMAGLVEKAIAAAVEVLEQKDAQRITEVLEIEEHVNSAEMEIDSQCLKTLATQSPLAGDLRFILAAIKINNDLERMVDQAVNVANNAEFYLNHNQGLEAPDLTRMAAEVRGMVRQTIDSFVLGDEAIARAVLKRDDIVDRFKDEIFREIVEQMHKDPRCIEQGINLILIARNLERIGDHATNIAEDVIFTISGVDIRHRSEKKGKQ